MKILIDEIKAEQLAARKARNIVDASLLTTLIGEAEMVGKSAGNRASTNDEVLQTVKKFEKNILENIRIYTERKMLDDVGPYAIAMSELKIIQRFLPAKLTDEKVKDDIQIILDNTGLVREQKSLGVIVKELKVRYGDQFDGQQVSGIFKRMLA